MPVYHSAMNEVECRVVSSCSILPLKTKVRGPAPVADDGATDIVDEALDFFRANVLFSSFEVKGGADRCLIYLTLYISQCLKRLEKAKNKDDGGKILFALSNESFPMPGGAGWQLGGHIPAAESRSDSDTLRSYFKQMREETGRRLLEKVFDEAGGGAPNKWWMSFSKRKFMNITVR